LAIFWIIIFAMAGLYTIYSARKLVNEVYRVILACSTGLMLIVILIFFQRQLLTRVFIVLAAWVLAIFYVSIARAWFAAFSD